RRTGARGQLRLGPTGDRRDPPGQCDRGLPAAPWPGGLYPRDRPRGVTPVSSLRAMAKACFRRARAVSSPARVAVGPPREWPDVPMEGVAGGELVDEVVSQREDRASSLDLERELGGQCC